MKQYWKDLGSGRQAGLLLGILVILAVTVAIGIWSMKPDYGVLFSDLSEADAAVITAELDRQKIPYEIGGNGTTLLGPKTEIYKTRMKLMGQSLPLHGAVGFELFNNSDFGMTEFAQKVNYQRALQGELTRTIETLESVKTARVHIVLADHGLFKAGAAKPKASVTLWLKPGFVMSQEQIVGIQRLVSASVPEVAREDVTVVDEQGIAVSRAAGSGNDSGASELDGKRALESYLSQKANAVLDQAVGAGHGSVVVDVSLNLDKTEVTTEEVLAAKGTANDGPQAGVIVREKTVYRDAPGTDDPSASIGAKMAQSGNSTTETEYQNGRRVEQLVVAPGAIKSLNIAIVVRGVSDSVSLDRLRDLVAAAVGYNKVRGDVIAIQIASLPAKPAETAAIPVESTPQLSDAERNSGAQAIAPNQPAATNALVVRWLITLIFALVALGLMVLAVRRPGSTEVHSLTPSEKAALLAKIKGWLEAGRPRAENTTL